MKYFSFLYIVILFTSTISCSKVTSKSVSKIPVIFDTDANNELDDQHALAYLLLNSKTFNVLGVTTNATYNGGEIEEHNKEAERVIRLCKAENKVPLLTGANSNFETIKQELHLKDFDGNEGVNFIIKKAKSFNSNKKLVILAVGKLTNVALAVKKDSTIIDKIRLVWLGANYPKSGEYNLENDISAMNYLLQTSIEFEMVTVRYGEPSGTDAVKVYETEVSKMKGLGPEVTEPVIGRHGESHTNFGDYSYSLFKHANYYGNPPARSLFDMAAVTIVKNPKWAKSTEIPSPIMIENNWVEQPKNPRKIIVWEHFEKEKILNDFYNSLQHYELIE